MSSFAGQADIAIGNAVGSNICNILLVLGLSAVVTPLAVTKQVIRSDDWSVDSTVDIWAGWHN